MYAENTDIPGQELYVGIDLGTTNSVVATVKVLPDGRLLTPIVKVERKLQLGPRGTFKRGKSELLPSAVGYREGEDGSCEVIVGDFAKSMARTKPFAVALSVKSQMGNPRLDIPGFKKSYPDKKPEEVSARILKQLLKAVDDQYYVQPKRAVITVPACFNAAQCEATLKAAELAGLDVRDKEGRYREDVLLAEPEAVIYDVVNQMQNGSLSLPVDFKEPKNVMVFDIGGGTLDITLHRIGNNKDNPRLFDIQPIAINRYSSIAGDTFDRLLAEKLFERYIRLLDDDDPQVALETKKKKERHMPYIIEFAEELKLVLSDRYCQQKEMGRTLTPKQLLDYGGDMPNGYSCEDSMSVGEIEACFKPLMGSQYVFDDYKRFEELTDERNIIYPVLDVLKKAQDKTGEAAKVDCLIMNGGMSRLYLIQERLEAFLGLKPLQVNDPDKSVAQGAAVYHYYMSKNTAAEVRHQNFAADANDYAAAKGTPEENEDASAAAVAAPRRQEKRGGFRDVTKGQKPAAKRGGAAKPTVKQVLPAIRTVGSILNEALYLGTKGGQNYLLAKSGQELPYTSPLIKGFSIAARQKTLSIPIRQLGVGGKYMTIASGRLKLPRYYVKDMPVEIKFSLKRSNLMNFEVWVEEKLVGEMEIILGGEIAAGGSAGRLQQETLAAKPRLKYGLKLTVADELEGMRALLLAFEKTKNNGKPELYRKLRPYKKRLVKCGNPEDFAQPLLELLKEAQSPEARITIMTVARKQCGYWSQADRKQWAEACMSYLEPELEEASGTGAAVTANIETIRTLGLCGSAEDCVHAQALAAKNGKYVEALLQACGQTGTMQEWIYSVFLDKKERKASLQQVMQCLGMSIYNARELGAQLDINRVLSDCVEAGCSFTREQGSQAAVGASVLTAALVCAKGGDGVLQENQQSVSELVAQVEATETLKSSRCVRKAIEVAKRLLSKEKLEEADEKFLLGLLSPELEDEQG